MSTSVAAIRSRFRAQLTALQTGAKAAYAAALMQAPRRWFNPDPGAWSGDLSDLPGMSAAFDRSDNSTDYQAAIKDGQNPGVVGDLMASQLQGDYLAVLERAYRARHHSSVRCLMHAAARYNGHADPKGLFQQGVLGYLANIIKAAQGGSNITKG